MDDEQRITAIENQEKRGNRRSIFIDGKFALGVDESVIADLGLRIGQQISEAELTRVVRAEQIARAKEKSLRLLDFRARSKTEIARSLSRAHFDEDVIEETLERLEALKLLDDAQFSRAWVAHRLSGKGMGKMRIKWELRQKGVPNEVAEQALSAVDSESEYQSALRMAGRHWDKNASLDERIRRRRLSSYLQRQGYGWETIKTILNELTEESEPQ